MNLYPAIDLLDGKVVRLREGRRDQATIYSADPGEVARRFAADGARRLHVVDLDGAFAGTRANHAALQHIMSANIPVQLGGGVRDLATCAALLDGGVDRVVLGTAMVKSRGMVIEACARWPGRVVVAIDARDGKVAVEGWAEETALAPEDLAALAVEAGVTALLYTDIRRDGLATGPNVEATARLARVLHPVEVIASGGIASLADLRELALAGVPAAVVGRALYDGHFTLADAIVAAGAQS